MPLGGIGTGSIALAGDGSLRQWQIHNQVNHMACVPHSFFAVWTRRTRPADEPIARVLQSAALYDVEAPPTPPTSSDHVVPIPHRRLLSKLPGVEATEFTGDYPVGTIRYQDAELPVDVSLEAFNPFIPLNSKDSALPAILFNITVTNPGDHARLVSIAASLQNAVGWDGVAPIFDTKCQLYGGNSNALIRTGDLTAITMGSSTLPGDAPGYGTMVLSARDPEATYISQWADLNAFWDDFRTDGQLNNTADTTPSLPGRTWNGALAVPFTLQPGESRTIPFVLAWHFPNRYVNWDQAGYIDVDDRKSKFWLGNQYASWFRSAMDVVGYIEQERDRLTRETRLARDTFYDTTLPFPLIESVVSQTSIIRSPTCFWTESGEFYGFEGCNGASTLHHTEPFGGCCPLNCTHVWNYEMSLSRLFPQLERSMRDTEWNIQQHPTGYLPHRVALPAYLPRSWDRPIGGPENPALDGLLGAVLKTYREYRGSGDDVWLDTVWPSVMQALEHIWGQHDPERTGVIEGEQPNTYDISIYGANTFIGTLYLASLRSVEEMARRRGDTDIASECRKVYERGREALEARLWNGEYYIQEVDLEKYPEQNWGLGCHTDHLLGQWWAHYLDLGHILDPGHVRQAALSVFEHNFRENFHGFWEGFEGGMQQERQYVTEEDAGLIICTWPRGGRPEVPTRYSDEIWTGLEYEVAALLLYEGDVEPALRILEATRARYDGRKQNPWNDIECGDHYVRAMSSWALLEAASGYRYDAAAGFIGFDPVVEPKDFRSPFVARDGWGTFSHRVTDGIREARLELGWGHLELKRIALGSDQTGRLVLAEVGGVPVDVTLVEDEDNLAIEFGSPVTLRPDQDLRITLS
jgi:uncharacterized protein (DUF608 family)